MFVCVCLFLCAPLACIKSLTGLNIILLIVLFHFVELVKCPGCGEQVPLMSLRKHERELCVNRRVHCRNHPLGCNVMVRLKDRALHEQVDDSKALRSALFMPSHGAHLSVAEDDISCPWTAEVRTNIVCSIFYQTYCFIFVHMK